MLRALLFFVLLFCCFSTSAAAAQNPWIATLYFENDLFTGTDSDYTNGIKYSIISPDLSPAAPKRNVMQIPYRVLDFFHRFPLIKNAPRATSHRAELAFGQNIYTPRDISRFDLITDDRPYAGYSYVAMSFHRKSDFGALRSQMDTMEVQFGMVGSASLGEQAQKFVHRVRGLQRPNGWEHQLRDEPALGLIFERKWLFHPPQRQRFGADAILHTGMALGNVMTYANAGVEVRAGWNVPRSFGVSLIRPAGSTWHDEEPGLSLYLFGAANGRAVARDIFLDGNSFRSSHSVEREDWVADLSTGVTLSYESLTLSIAHNTRTREFAAQPKAHSFGSVVLSYAF